MQIPYHDHYRAYWSPPPGPYSNSLMGFLGALGLSLSTDKSVYKVGESPVYRIVGAIPGSVIAWSSTKNGQQTGEYQSNYGATVDANGTAEIVGGAWSDSDKGQWQKTAMILRADGNYDLSNVASFSVVAAPATAPVPPGQTSTGGFLDGSITIPILGTVPKLEGYAAIALAAYGVMQIFGKKGR